MPNVGYDPQHLAEAVALLSQHRTVADASRASGIPYSTLERRYKEAKRREELDPGISTAMREVGTNMVPQLAWLKTKSEDGMSVSVLLKPAKDETQPEDVLDRIADRLSRVVAAPFIARPVAPSADLRHFLPVFDAHMSLKVGSYGTAEAVARIKEGATEILGRAPPAECTIILNGGDFTEQNDPSNQTPASKHPLSVDMEYDDVTDIATDVTVDLIEMALQRSEHVIYKALKANHDPNTSRILRAALRQRYRDEPRVTIQTDAMEFFAHEWGSNLICAAHGHAKGKKPADYVMGMAAMYPEMWGRTKYRELWTGHLHSLLTAELPGMVTYRVRAIAPMGNYARENLWFSESEMQLVTYRKTGGRAGTTNHIFPAIAA